MLEVVVSKILNLLCHPWMVGEWADADGFFGTKKSNSNFSGLMEYGSHYLSFKAMTGSSTIDPALYAPLLHTHQNTNEAKGAKNAFPPSKGKCSPRRSLHIALELTPSIRHQAPSAERPKFLIQIAAANGGIFMTGHPSNTKTPKAHFPEETRV